MHRSQRLYLPLSLFAEAVEFRILWSSGSSSSKSSSFLLSSSSSSPSCSYIQIETMPVTESNCSVSYRVLENDGQQNATPGISFELRLRFIFQWVIFPSPEDNDDQQEGSPSSERPAAPEAAQESTQETASGPPPEAAEGVTAPVVLQVVEGPTIVRTSQVNPRFLTSELVTDMVVHDMIFDLNLPATMLATMRSNISSLVCSMARQEFRRASAVSPVIVEVELRTSFPYDDDDEGHGDGNGVYDVDDDDEADGNVEEEEVPTEGLGLDDTEDVSFRAVPAERAAIESLARIRFDGQENECDKQIFVADHPEHVEEKA